MILGSQAVDCFCSVMSTGRLRRAGGLKSILMLESRNASSNLEHHVVIFVHTFYLFSEVVRQESFRNVSPIHILIPRICVGSLN